MYTEAIKLNEYVNENADIFDDEPKKQNIVLRIFKWVCAAIIILICGILFVRCVGYMDHKIVKKVLMNEAFYTAYEQSPEQLKVEKYGMKDAWVRVREGRQVEFNNLYYIPLLKQMQFSIKYNQDLPQCEYSEMPFRLKLIDDEGNEFTEYWFEEAQRERYKYVRICFENIDIYTDKVDENGQEIRHTYTLVIDMTDGKGGYNELCTYKLYDGKTICKNVKYKVEK